MKSLVYIILLLFALTMYGFRDAENPHVVTFTAVHEKDEFQLNRNNDYDYDDEDLFYNWENGYYDDWNPYEDEWAPLPYPFFYQLDTVKGTYGQFRIAYEDSTVLIGAQTRRGRFETKDSLLILHESYIQTPLVWFSKSEDMDSMNENSTFIWIHDPYSHRYNPPMKFTFYGENRADSIVHIEKLLPDSMGATDLFTLPLVVKAFKLEYLHGTSPTIKVISPKRKKGSYKRDNIVVSWNSLKSPKERYDFIYFCFENIPNNQTLRCIWNNPDTFVVTHKNVPTMTFVEDRRRVFTYPDKHYVPSKNLDE